MTASIGFMQFSSDHFVNDVFVLSLIAFKGKINMCKIYKKFGTNLDARVIQSRIIKSL